MYIELLQIALGNKSNLSRMLNDDEWFSVYKFAEEQAIVGILARGLDKLPQAQLPRKDLLLQWIGRSEMIKQQNIVVNQRCVELCDMLKVYGFQCCILKGQGNAMMYPEPSLRQPGDIDIWVDDTKDKIASFVKERFPWVHDSGHHIDFPIFRDVSVEMHYEPTYSIFFKYQKNLRRFIEHNREKQFRNRIQFNSSTISFPTNEFNVVYQMSHMQDHFFYGGLGLRQIVDYFYLLKRIDRISIDYSKQFKDLGMLKFASAIMWILMDVFRIENDRVFVTPDKKRGKLVLNEILRSGNFGKFDKRISGRLYNKSATFSIIIRNLKTLYLFPRESISAPLTGIARRFL